MDAHGATYFDTVKHALGVFAHIKKEDLVAQMDQVSRHVIVCLDKACPISATIFRESHPSMFGSSLYSVWFY